jgi:hypothetical protein
MSAVKRRLFNMLAAASLLLCIGTTALWIRSTWTLDSVEWTRVGARHSHFATAKRLELGTAYRGGLYLAWASAPTIYSDGASVGGSSPGLTFQYTHKPTARISPIDWSDPMFAHIDRLAVAGFHYGDLGTTSFGRNFIVNLPLWFPTLITLVLPATLWLSRLRRSRRANRLLCPACGYDLRATPERCPECGLPVKPTA